MVRLFGDGPYSGLAGDPRSVADTILSYENLGISRCTICELVPGTLVSLAAAML